MSGWKNLSILCVVGCLSVAVVGPVAAQDASPAAPAVALRIDLALSRHDGNKVVSNLPFTLMTTMNQPARIRIGSEVPIQNGSGGPVRYQNVGTNIDARVESAGTGTYRLSIGIEDASVAETDGGTPNSALHMMPVIRSNTLHTVLLLRDGQATELVVATDKVTGETVKAQVRVTAVD